MQYYRGVQSVPLQISLCCELVKRAKWRIYGGGMGDSDLAHTRHKKTFKTSVSDNCEIISDVKLHIEMPLIII